MDKEYWWGKAIEAAAVVGWYPTVIFAQWAWETGHFTSANLLHNNNIAGQTWQPYMGERMKGTPRPAAEGGYYIRYDDPVTGYTDFISKNGRYARVKDAQTEEAQIRAIAAAGWAVDKNYANGLISVLRSHNQQGYTKEEAERVMKAIEELQGRVAQLEGMCQTLYKTAEAHIEEINALKSLAKCQTVPAWAQEAVSAALVAGMIDTPEGGSYDFYRLLTVMQRKGLI